MKKREAAFTTKFILWAKHNWHDGSALFEVKVASEGKPISFGAIKPHQLANLRNAHQFIYKLSDAGMTTMPCDVVCIQNGAGYLVFNYGSKQFYIFEVNEFMRMVESYPRKSIHESDAHSLATLTGTLA